MELIKIFDKGNVSSNITVAKVHDNPKYFFTRWGADSGDVLGEDQMGDASRMFSSERTYSLRLMKSDYSECICEIFLNDEDLHNLIMKAELVRAG